MPTMTFNRNPLNIGKYGSALMYINELDSSTGAETAWAQFEIFRDSKISQEIESSKENDDAGAVVVDSETISSVMLEGLCLPRDEKVRKMFGNSKGKFYRVVIIGFTMSDGKSEVWSFGKCKLSLAFSYDLGGEGKMPFKLTAFKVDAATAVTFPASSAISSWPLSTTSTSIPAGEFYVTADLA